MTDLDMLRHLLKKTGRLYDEVTQINRTIIQVYVFEGRVQFEFDVYGNLEEDWNNDSYTTWISAGGYIE